MTKETPPTVVPFALVAAAQAATLDVLRAEMSALSNLMPGHPTTDPAEAEAREARHNAEFEAAFDDVPV